MASTEREYEIVLFGASGYTGKYTAEFIAKVLPTNLKWAVAGRTASKLNKVIDEIKPLNSDRIPPSVEICSLDPSEIDVLTKKTKVLINVVGPYCLYATPVVEACAQNGTHYIDTTGEVPWVLDMINKYHDLAKANNAIIIPQAGFESAAADLLVLAMSTMAWDTLSADTKDVTLTLYSGKTAPSGGTLATMMAIFDVFGPGTIGKSTQQWALSPRPGPKHSPAPLLRRLFGVRNDPDLGLVTTSLFGATDAPIVERSSGLLNYGPQFRYAEFSSVSNRFFGAAMHLGLIFGATLLTLRPVRWLLKKLSYAPGDGPSQESAKDDHAELRGVAKAATEPERRISGRLRWDGSFYALTGAFLATGAIVLAREDAAVRRVGGGILTPASLGQRYIDRMREVGLAIETKLMD